MKQLLLTCAIISMTPLATLAAPVDTIGGAEGTQTIHHCGTLPTLNTIYTDSPVTISIIEEKLVRLGYLTKPGNGTYTKADKKAVRTFQREEGLAVDGVVGPITAQRLAYVSHPSANVHRCFNTASARR